MENMYLNKKLAVLVSCGSIAVALGLGACSPKLKGSADGVVSTLASSTGYSSTPSKLLFSSTNGSVIADATCNEMSIQPYNSADVMTAPGSDINITLAGVGLGNFYSDSSCSTSITSTILSAGSLSKTLYFKPVLPGATNSVTLTLTATDDSGDLTAASQTAYVNETIVDFDSNGEVACAVIDSDGSGSGAVQCWGLNFYGTVGNSKEQGSPSTPQQVSGITSDATVVSVGGYHACAVVDGGVQCWGDNSQGQLGNGTTTDSSTPVQPVAASSGVIDVYSGNLHTCAIYSTNQMTCWGDNSAGQLGNNNSGTDSTTPVTVVSSGGAGTFTTAASFTGGMASNFACVRTTGSEVYCWGENGSGQVGNNNSGTDQAYPAQVDKDASNTALDNVSQIVSGLSHTCALTTGGNVYCWGDGTRGQLGDGADTSYAYATLTFQIDNLSYIYAGSRATCAVTSGGAVYCSGQNNYNKLGITSSTDDILTMTATTNWTSGVSKIAVGTTTSCWLNTAGTLDCIGKNITGVLGNDTTTESAIPYTMSTLTAAATKVGTGLNFSCALVGTEVYCWGANPYGQTSNTADSYDETNPYQVPISEDATDLAVGLFHACALLSSGKVQCWGRSDNGELGDNSTASDNCPDASYSCSTTPVYVIDNDTGIALTGATQISAGGVGTTATGMTVPGFSCAIVGTGVKCWGDNTWGQIGDGTSGTDRTKAITVIRASDDAAISGATQVAAGGGNACALVGTGVYCWGLGGYGQNGDGNGSLTNTKAVIVRNSANSADLSGATYVSAGALHACAVVSSGVQCWGSDVTGELGDGAGSSTTCLGKNCSKLPVNFEDGGGVLTNATVVEAGGGLFYLGDYYGVTCVIDNGAAKCAGENTFGTLGNNTYTSSNTAVSVSGLTSSVSSISVGMNHVCAVHSNQIKCWGSHTNGQLGIGNNASHTETQEVLSWE